MLDDLIGRRVSEKAQALAAGGLVAENSRIGNAPITSSSACEVH
jgi:hypothetical protein